MENTFYIWRTHSTHGNPSVDLRSRGDGSGEGEKVESAQ
jgi:hypothetical protein